MSDSPIVCIDGPSGSGKGTIAALLAERLGWHVLDSGALYRLTGLAASRAGIDLADEAAVAAVADGLEVAFEGGHVRLAGEDVSTEIRTETAGNNASKVAALPAVRSALLAWQRRQARPPGLVADGRDMGSVVFPEADLKIFLDASPAERAKRRYNQLIEKGLTANLPSLVAELEERDKRDRERTVAPLAPAPGAELIDSTGLSIDQVLTQVLARLQAVRPDLRPL